MRWRRLIKAAIVIALVLLVSVSFGVLVPSLLTRSVPGDNATPASVTNSPVPLASEASPTPSAQVALMLSPTLIPATPTTARARLVVNPSATPIPGPDTVPPTPAAVASIGPSISVSSSSTPPPGGRVGNTGGLGTYLRHSALQSDHWLQLSDGTLLVLLGSQAERDGDSWLLVRDPGGNVGWIQSRYVVLEKPNGP